MLDEAGDGEHGDAGSEREGGVGVAHVVEVAERLDPGGFLGGFPVAAAEVAVAEVATVGVAPAEVASAEVATVGVATV